MIVQVHRPDGLLDRWILFGWTSIRFFCLLQNLLRFVKKFDQCLDGFRWCSFNDVLLFAVFIVVQIVYFMSVMTDLWQLKV